MSGNPRLFRWSGNVLQLRNVIERATVVARRPLLAAADLPLDVRRAGRKGPHFELRIGESLDEVEREFIFKTLDFTNGNKVRAAQILGISLKTLYNRLVRYNGKRIANRRTRNVATSQQLTVGFIRRLGLQPPAPITASTTTMTMPITALVVTARCPGAGWRRPGRDPPPAWLPVPQENVSPRSGPVSRWLVAKPWNRGRARPDRHRGDLGQGLGEQGGRGDRGPVPARSLEQRFAGHGVDRRRYPGPDLAELAGRPSAIGAGGSEVLSCPAQ